MTGCFSYFAATLNPYVRVSASFAFHEDFFRMNKEFMSFLENEKTLMWQKSSRPYFSAWLTLVNLRVTEMFEFSICLLVIFLVHVVQSVLQGNKHPIVEVKREEGCKTKATRRTNQ